MRSYPDNRGHKNLNVTTDGAHTWTQVDLPTREQPTQVTTGDGPTGIV